MIAPDGADRVGTDWYALCDAGYQREVIEKYPILYIVGAIVVIIVILKLLGLY